MAYGRVTQEVIIQLKAIAGERNVITDPEAMEAYSHDEVPERKWRFMPEVVIKPGSAQEISDILKIANRERIPVTPRGAGTGLAAGAVPFYGGIVLSLEGMNQIIEVDRENLFMIVEPGVTTGDVQRHASELGYLYAGDPCSAESSFIGGNIATNAGGNKAVKYGCTSKHVYGLEVVLPQGDILKLGGKCVKDATGYDLVHLMVGSEGTLGIVTKVYLKLLPRPKFNAVLMAPFVDMQSAIDLVPKILNLGGIVPTSIEFMDQKCIKAAERFLERKLPFNDAGAHLIIEVDASTESQLMEDMQVLADICSRSACLEVFVGDNPTTQERIWKPRRVLAEALRVTSPVYCMEDVVVPVNCIPRLVGEIEEIAKEEQLGVACFGHAGDGNIHATLLKEAISDEIWEERKERVLNRIYDRAYSYGGNISGEHGIGAKRKESLSRYADPVKLGVMKSIKQALDPNLILNPGKIFNIDQEGINDVSVQNTVL